MKEHDTFPGKIYAVTCASGCTITDNKGRTLGECGAGKQTLVVATSDKLLTSADALLTATFKYAPAKLKLLGLLGGGSSTGLPSGYLEALFLESDGTRTISTGYTSVEGTGLYAKSLPVYGNRTVMGYKMQIVPPCPKMVNTTPGYIQAHWAGTTIIFVKTTKPEIVEGYINWQNSKTAKSISSLGVHVADLSGTPENGEIKLFSANANWYGRIYEAGISEGTQIIRNYISAISPDGSPCMYELMQGSTLKGSGTNPFIVGLTAKQAKKLERLPETGGTLKISLPNSIVSGDTVTDSAVNAALTTARSKGWNITVQTYTEDTTAAASAFGFRRIWVRKTEDENGSYVDAEGNRWQVDWCVTMYTPDDSTPDMHGYELFRSVEAACDYWGLEPWVDPAWEEEFLTNQEL